MVLFQGQASAPLRRHEPPSSRHAYTMDTGTPCSASSKRRLPSRCACSSSVTASGDAPPTHTVVAPVARSLHVAQPASLLTAGAVTLLARSAARRRARSSLHISGPPTSYGCTLIPSSSPSAPSSAKSLTKCGVAPPPSGCCAVAAGPSKISLDVAGSPLTKATAACTSAAYCVALFHLGMLGSFHSSHRIPLPLYLPTAACAILA